MPLPEENRENGRLTAKEMVYRSLRDWIVDGTMEPGEVLNDTEIADYFHVSRTPVREAVLMLQDQKLVEVFPSRETRVAALDRESAFRVYEAMAQLSAAVSDLAVQKCGRQDILRLRELNDSFAAAAKAAERDHLPVLDEAFHQGIADIAANPHLAAFCTTLGIHARRYELIYYHKGTDLEQSVEEHNAIITALERKDREQAAAASRDNWLGFYKRRLEGLL